MRFRKGKHRPACKGSNLQPEFFLGEFFAFLSSIIKVKSFAGKQGVVCKNQKNFGEMLGSGSFLIEPVDLHRVT